MKKAKQLKYIKLYSNLYLFKNFYIYKVCSKNYEIYYNKDLDLKVIPYSFQTLKHSVNFIYSIAK